MTSCGSFCFLKSKPRTGVERGIAIPEVRVRLLRLPAGFVPVESSAPHGPPPCHEQPGRPRGSGNQAMHICSLESPAAFSYVFSLVNDCNALEGSFDARHSATDLVGSPCQRIIETCRYFCFTICSYGLRYMFLSAAGHIVPSHLFTDQRNRPATVVLP